MLQMILNDLVEKLPCKRFSLYNVMSVECWAGIERMAEPSKSPRSNTCEYMKIRYKLDTDTG